MKKLKRIILLLVMVVILLIGLVFVLLNASKPLSNEERITLGLDNFFNIGGKIDKILEKNEEYSKEIKDAFYQNLENNEDGNEIYYDDSKVEGVLEFTTINESYPILDKVMVKNLKVGIGVLYGPGINKIWNTTLCGMTDSKYTFFENFVNFY